ncbi:N-acetyltransferase ESCO2, partial [Asbolus verrucosus]
ATVMKPQHPHIQHTAEFSSRRRALFPCDENSADSDLGCISPLNFDSDRDDGCLKEGNVFSLNKCVGDYDIIGLVDKSSPVGTPETTPNPPTSVTNKIITPCHILDDLVDESPTQKLKTPHDTSTNSRLPKLIRKTAVDTLLSDANSSDLQAVDCKNSKVRTALFPEMPLPTKTFYPNKTETDTSPRSFIRQRKSSPKRSSRRENLYLCNRRSRFRTGQINAGVSHKIKKTKKIRKISKIAAFEAAMNIIENSPLNGFLNDSANPEPPRDPSPRPEFRDPSPEPEPDPSKKFFKSSHHKGVVTVNGNIKLEMSNGKLSLMPPKNGLKRPRKAQDEVCAKRPRLTDEFDGEKAEPLIPSQDVSSIIESLEDKENERRQEPVILMSPTSQMCNMTSGLALNSPKKAKNLNAVLETMPTPDQKKFFPVFYPGKTVVPPRVDQLKNSASAKKIRPVSKDQMLLDAGQKRFGVTQCPECKIVYHMGDPGDEIMHVNYHNAGHIFRFNGWKNERVVSGDIADGKIIQIVPNDPKIWWKKVKDVMEVVNRDLGFYDIEFNTANSQIFFYVKNKVIVGALAAEAKASAHRLLTTHQDQVDLCSEEAYPVKCGVSRIWVSQSYRKKGIATSLMNSLKRNFMFGCILKNDEIAFSSPTEMGKIFGRSYFKTPNFLIYFV